MKCFTGRYNFDTQQTLRSNNLDPNKSMINRMGTVCLKRDNSGNSNILEADSGDEDSKKGSSRPRHLKHSKFWILSYILSAIGT